MQAWILLLALLPAAALAQPKKVLYITHSAGFRHDCLPLSQQVLRDIAARAGGLDLTATEDLSALNDLRDYSAVAFFTSGELSLSAEQKEGLLAFIRNGGGFLGFHSATDTLYTWPEYGDLIGARFDGHPWVQSVRIDIEDPTHPATRHLTPSFTITDEIYQFREFSRDKVRVLMTLDTGSVDPHAAGVNRTDNDFALAWVRPYGNGRMFYTALGHFEDTWRDPRFQQMVEQSLLWVTEQIGGEPEPQPIARPALATDGLGNAATMQPPMTIAPGSFVSIFGTQLTSGATMAADIRTASHRLAGTRVSMNGSTVPVIYASPGQINALAPLDLQPRDCSGRPCMEVTVDVPRSNPLIVNATFAPMTPGIFTTTVQGTTAVLWATGLGTVRPSGGLQETIARPAVSVNGREATVFFSGLAPGWPGLYQVNVSIPQGVGEPYNFTLTVP
jgi:uncharacterized protein (TIGR03437 family)